MYIFLGVAHVLGVTAGHDYLGFPGCIGIGKFCKASISSVIKANNSFALNIEYLITLGIVTHYFFLATFCWLFLISLDLFWTFK